MRTGVWPFSLRGTATLIGGAVLLAVSIVLGLVALRIVALAIILLPVLMAVLVLSARPVRSVQRRLGADVVPIGEGVRVTVTWERGPRLGCDVAWADSLPDGLTGAAEGELAAGGDAFPSVTYDVRAVRRGTQSIGPFRVLVSDPLALARRRLTLETSTKITITPELVELAPLTLLAGAAVGAHHATTSRLGQGSDDLIARPFAPGDSRRRIHWRASAHRDELMVRQEERESTPDATVVLDRAIDQWGPTARDIGADPGFERALSAVASTADRLVREGFAVTVVDTEGTVILDHVDSGAGIRTLLRVLASMRTTTRPVREPRLPRDREGPLVLVGGASALREAPVAAGRPAMLLGVGAPETEVDAALRAGWHGATIPLTDDGLRLAWSDLMAEVTS